MQDRVRKGALIGAGLVVLVGAIIVLRTPEPTGSTGPPPAPPPQTSVKPFTAQGVVAPAPGARPAPPATIKVRAGTHRLELAWGKADTGNPEPTGAAGYEVRWGIGRDLRNVRLVGEPAVQLDGLTDGTTYNAEVRTVDSWGQRSTPAAAAGAPGNQDNATYAFADRFDGQVLDPARWRLLHPDTCEAGAAKENALGPLVVTANCGSGSATLQARAPLRLSDGYELGRVVVQTDAPGQAGELLVDLVPGAVGLIGRSPLEPPLPGDSGAAILDPSLPPGAIRVRASANPSGAPVEPGQALSGPTTTVQVLSASAPSEPRAVIANPVPAPRIRTSVRWEVILTRGGVRVMRDGVLVAAGDVVPTWTEAAVSVGFAGPAAGGLRAAVDLVAFAGAATEIPAYGGTVPLGLDHRVGTATQAPPPTGVPLAGVRGAQLRLTLLPVFNQSDIARSMRLGVEVAGVIRPLRPAIEGQPLALRVRYPVVADLPPEALVLVGAPGLLGVRVINGALNAQLIADVEQSSIELFSDGPPPAAGPAGAPPVVQQARLAQPEPTLRDAAGRTVSSGGNVTAGRMVLDLVLDGPQGQRTTGELAGLAGVEVRADGVLLAAIATTTDGPGVGGRWQIGLVTGGLTPGPHTLAIKVVPTDAAITPASAFVLFVVAA